MAAADVGQSLADHLAAFTYEWSTERDLHEAMWPVITERYPQARREVVLSRRDRPDFVVPANGVRIAVEVKVAGARNAIWRQIGRYAEHDAIDGIVFACAKRALLAGTPAVLHGKPVAVTVLAGAL